MSPAMLSEVITWGRARLPDGDVGPYLWVALALYVASSVVAMGVALLVVLSLPATYFQDNPVPAPPAPPSSRTRRILKNLLGGALVVVGLLLSVPGVPGQGVLVMLMGVILLDIPAKRKLEQRLLGRPRVLAAMNRLRARFGKPPLLGKLQ
jgi:hypothetical protein